MGATNTMMFRTSMNNFRNEPAFKMLVEAETGKRTTVTVTDAETMETVLVLTVPEGAAMNLSSAFGLAASMEAEQLKDDLIRDND